MSTLEHLMKLRPAGDTAADLAASLSRTADAAKQAQADVAEAQQLRDASLLEGTAEELDAAGKTLGAARDVLEQLEAMARRLDEKHAQAEWAEVQRAVQQDADAVEQAKQELMVWHDMNLPAVRALAEQGGRLALQVDAAAEAWRQSADRVAEEAKARGIVDYDPPQPEPMATEHARDFARLAAEIVETSDHRGRSAGAAVGAA